MYIISFSSAGFFFFLFWKRSSFNTINSHIWEAGKLHRIAQLSIFYIFVKRAHRKEKFRLVLQKYVVFKWILWLCNDNLLWIGDLQNDFRSKQLLLTVHIWMIHRRLIAISKETEDSAKKKAMLNLQVINYAYIHTYLRTYIHSNTVLIITSFNRNVYSTRWK